MTTLVAVQKNGRRCIASDSLTLFGSRKEISGKHVGSSEKIFQIGHNYIGISGHASWPLILKHYFSGKKKIPLWKTTDEIFETFNTMHRNLKDIYFLTPSYSPYEPVESSDLGIIIINSFGIFEIDYLRVCREHIDFCAIGTGEEYALGAMKALYNRMETPKEIAQAGIEAAALYDRKTSLPVHSCALENSRL